MSNEQIDHERLWREVFKQRKADKSMRVGQALWNAARRFYPKSECLRGTPMDPYMDDDSIGLFMLALEAL